MADDFSPQIVHGPLQNDDGSCGENEKKKKKKVVSFMSPRTDNNSGMEEAPNHNNLDFTEPTTVESTSTESGKIPLDNEPASLEGILLFRRGRSSGSSLPCWWRRRYVVLNLLDGGSISCYSFTADNYKGREAAFISRSKFSKLHRRLSLFGDGSDVLSLHIPASIPWCVKDVENDGSCFVIEIETSGEDDNEEPEEDISTVPLEADGNDFSQGSECDDPDENDAIDYFRFRDTRSQDAALSDSSDDLAHELEEEEKEEEYEMDADGSLYRDMLRAQVHGKPLRFYFKCQKGGNEKSLWLKAFSNMDRLSLLFRKKNTFLGALKAPVRFTHSRTRSDTSAAFAIEGTRLENDDSKESDVNIHIWNHEKHHRGRNGREKEHRVIPEYCYPHRWMTQTELQEEMLRESECFHDLRQPNCNIPEVGQLKVEVLAALGLPKLDRLSDSDACVYIVCQQYAFNTDVIKDKNNPMWLAKTQRACTIPIHHAYARLYIGVFDDEKSTKDDFNGRIVLDLTRLRPDSTYDVTLPLRLSKHVYTRRRRGAIRFRVKLQWTNLQAALLSYLPKRIRIPRNFSEFSPNTDTTVLTGDSRAFRNVAITVHGSHLPGRFSFQQLRATLREINFTRKSVMTLWKQSVRDMRDWENPFMSAFVFFGWMHCIYSNSFALVPAYVVSFFMLHLVRNYAIYGMDGPVQGGFTPPSWEEMFLGLIRHPDASAAPSSIEPLNMGYHKKTVQGSEILDYKVETHEPLGKSLFRFLGFLDGTVDHPVAVEEAHLEFPFADGRVYPKFSVKDCLVSRSSKGTGIRAKGPKQRRTLINRFTKNVEMPDRLRKDSSGMNDYDDEEQRFATGKFIRKTGRQELKGALSGLKDVGESLTEVTGLQYMVSPFMSPIKGGLHYVVPPIRSGFKTGYQQTMPAIKSGIKTGRNLVVSPLHQTVHFMRRGSLDNSQPRPLTATTAVVNAAGNLLHNTAEMSSHDAFEEVPIRPLGPHMDGVYLSADGAATRVQGSAHDLDPKDLIPEQDIDFTSESSKKGNGSRKRLTDDLNETKDKMHEMTCHLFNDQAYVVKNSNSCYFGRAERSSKRRKLDLPRHLDKVLQTGYYSHSNPVVARVGQYVEPMVGASHSFLCAFRAIFNIMTWRDPFLTFWVSLFGFMAVFILFIFPWRIFLFVAGLWFVGPQNYAIRILRKKKILPPKKPRREPNKEAEESELPNDQVVFRGHITQDAKRKPHKPVDPREVQHVVVPHSPLMYQRFYDWPPEQAYAQTRADSTKTPYAKFSPGQASPMESGRSAKTRISANASANAYFTSTLSPVQENEKKKQ